MADADCPCSSPMRRVDGPALAHPRFVFDHDDEIRSAAVTPTSAIVDALTDWRPREARRRLAASVCWQTDIGAAIRHAARRLRTALLAEVSDPRHRVRTGSTAGPVAAPSSSLRSPARRVPQAARRPAQRGPHPSEQCCGSVDRARESRFTRIANLQRWLRNDPRAAERVPIDTELLPHPLDRPNVVERAAQI